MPNTEYVHEWLLPMLMEPKAVNMSLPLVLVITVGVVWPVKNNINFFHLPEVMKVKTDVVSTI